MTFAEILQALGYLASIAASVAAILYSRKTRRILHQRLGAAAPASPPAAARQ